MWTIPAIGVLKVVGEPSPETKGATKAESLRNHMRSQYLKPNVWPTEQKEEHITRTEGRYQGQNKEPEFLESGR